MELPPRPGIITFANGIFSVGGHHIYTATGSYNAIVTISEPLLGPDLPASQSSTIVVTDPPVSATAINTFSARVRVNIPPTMTTLGTFTDPGGSEPISNYTVISELGRRDTPPPSALSFANNVFTILDNSHLYDCRVPLGRISRRRDNQARDSTEHHIHGHRDDHRQAGYPDRRSVDHWSARRGNPVLLNVVATFTDPSGALPVGSYAAMIDWGDNTSSVGIVSFSAASNIFTVQSGHTYTSGGNFTVTTTITRGEGSWRA